MAEKRGRGRPPGAVSKAKRELAEMARDHAEAALDTLVRIATDGKAPAAARVTAASAILDRGYGKPAQAMTLSGDPNNPLPIVPVLNVTIGGTGPTSPPKAG